ncbi:MAG: tetratricopeptide repeat protein [Candidatus Izemoplasmatales bacterium]
MTLYDFSCNYYFKDRFDAIVLIDHYKATKGITQKEINEKADIPKSNFRRAQQKGFSGYEDMLQKMVDFFGIKSPVEPETVVAFDDHFSQFYTCICFSKFDHAIPYYEKLMAIFDQNRASILMIPAYLAQLIYYVSEVNYTNKINHAKIEEAVNVLKDFVDKMSNEHRFLYYEYMTAYAGIKKDPEKVVHYARLTIYMSANYPDFEPTSNYHVSFAYSMVGDYINGLIYANKALPKLEEQLNYNKAIFCRMNIATYYKKLGNVDEALRILKKNLIYLRFNDIQRLNRVTYISYADCMLQNGNHKEALDYYLKIENECTKKPEYESLMATYCMYRLGQFERASKYIDNLLEARRMQVYPDEYLSLVLFFRAFYEHASIEEIDNAYKNAEKYMPDYRFRGYFIQDVAKELHDELITKKATKPVKQVSSEDYLM